jgi:hypothetical protein
MRTLLSIALISTVCSSGTILPHANAAPCQGYSLAARMLQLPLIPLEKSLILRHPSSASGPTIAELPQNSHALANAIIRGLLVANRTKEIAYTAPLSYKVQDVVRGLRRGETLNKAGRYAGVSSGVVRRLLKLGTRSLDTNLDVN